MDLSALAPTDDSVEVEIRHPATGAPLHTEDGKPITISVYGSDSPAFQAQQRAIINKRLRSRDRKVIGTAESLEEESLTTLAACIAGWQNIEFDGKPLEFSRANARMLLGKLRWLRDQIDEAVGDRANFLTASSTT